MHKFFSREAPFLSLIMICGIITAIKCLYGNLAVQEMIVRLVIVCIIEIISYVVIVKKHINVGVEKERLSKKWNKMKKESLNS